MNHGFRTRRQALAGLGGIALPWLSAGCWPSLGLAGTGKPESPRLAVVMLRGALDGLAAVPAIGDPAWLSLRGELSPAGALPLDRMFALHPALPTLGSWYAEGHLLVLHAVASPYRERSHFDAQQQLESGGERPFALTTGWLGRALQHAGQHTAQGAAQSSANSAVALQAALPVALRGAEQASTWTPERSHGPDSEDLLSRVPALYAQDPALRAAWAQAMAQRGRQAMAEHADASGPQGRAGFVALARQAGQFLAAEHGPRVAWLESTGWDTHQQQGARLQRLLTELDQGLGALRTALGTHWARSQVLVMTEFGRSAKPNGTGGTDHGTGGIAWLAGGSVAGGRVWCDWPGLAPTQLLDGRDLRPTLDIRALQVAVLQRHFGLGRTALAQHVLPGAPQALDGLWRT